MFKYKKLILAFCAIILLCSICLCSCSRFYRGYDTHWIIGKTSAEIQERYGEFDYWFAPKPSDGLCCNMMCGYIVKEKYDSFVFYSWELILAIWFDSDGVAYKLEKDYPYPYA